ncbi:uncharacterized protein EURHEDRAFT_210637 [Aspergillus ruber CBS 135680]|uniref:Uncharacterized protein n=1 Tax=Aspergillus ruber (strain CBS 135680) TaxID=1388766 RepID=A0A017SQ67_ASPRC|nr:uncharacterized protein EURHEDRAFT_210637 [Aspergillus ruber CBS 135680]EYE98420.1 hypothetical protein EURHEDRAFT_210637 [Aspergillus ruber CBS 135680]
MRSLKTLCYGQISLVLLPNTGRIRNHFVVEVDIKHTKGHNRNQKVLNWSYYHCGIERISGNVRGHRLVIRITNPFMQYTKTGRL